MNIGSFIVDLEHLSLVSVIVDHHPGVADHRDAADLTGVEPAYMNMRVHAIRKFQVEMGDVFDA